jgi:hypothetical protein
LIVIESAEAASNTLLMQGLPAAKLCQPEQGDDLMIATLRPLAAFILLAQSPAFAQATWHDPPAGMSCPGDRFVPRRPRGQGASGKE